METKQKRMYKRISRSILGCVTILILGLLLAGCLNYKAPGAPGAGKAAETPAGDSLVDEIAQIEKQLQQEEQTKAEADKEAAEVEEEVAGEETPEALEDEVGEISETGEAGKELVEEEVVLPELEVEAEKAPGAGLQVVTVKENELVKLNVQVSDPDKDTVTYTFSKPLDEKGQWKTNYGDAGEYPVTITASDGKLTTEKKLKLVVERVNVPPVLEPLGDVRAREGDLVKLEPKATDPNKDKVTVTISDPLSKTSWQTDHTSAGEYEIKVVASDGELETEKMLKLIVEDVNVLPEVSNLPETLKVKEGSTVQLKPSVSDLDEDPITISMSEPVGDDGVWETSFTDHGDYVVTVTISDGKDTVVKKVAISVEDVNMPPQFVDISLQ